MHVPALFLLPVPGIYVGPAVLRNPVGLALAYGLAILMALKYLLQFLVWLSDRLSKGQGRIVEGDDVDAQGLRMAAESEGGDGDSGGHPYAGS